MENHQEYLLLSDFILKQWQSERRRGDEAQSELARLEAELGQLPVLRLARDELAATKAALDETRRKVH